MGVCRALFDPDDGRCASAQLSVARSVQRVALCGTRRHCLADDPWTSELAVEKYWKLPGGYLGIDGLTLETFDSDDEAARAKADADRLGLLETHDERGLGGMMHQAELAAMQGGWLDGNRADTRLFRQGPPDRFETQAQKFAKDFEGYIAPGLLDPPELATSSARLEGLPAEWKTLAGDDLKAYQNAELTLTRDPTDWHPCNPNAERDARIEAEGLYTDPIQQFTTLDEKQDAPVSPDFDL